ncbi:dihydropteroate synthase [Nocardioides sp.]|uniref:dihydropteroate synthase n=1 Tax=Nocardioides sp. TaxID=35761 RepID=UPI003D123362
MISLSALARLAAAHPDDLELPVAPLLIGDRVFDTDDRPVVMGTVNLSRDSTYRESVAISTTSAIRKARVQAAQGADLVDVGAESSTARAARVDPSDQIKALVPVVEALAADDILVSAESYAPPVVRATLEAGASVINLTGSADDVDMFDLAAEFGATVLICFVKGSNVREITSATVDNDPFPEMLEQFTRRLALARARGVERIVIDPGMGFYYGNLTDPLTRARHQGMVILNTFRLRRLGVPICHAMPHAFDLFEDEFRTAESFFAVLASLGGTGVFRTHEVPRVAAVLTAMRELQVG